MVKHFLFACLTLILFISVTYGAYAENKIIRNKTIRSATITAGNRLTVLKGGKTYNTNILDGGIEDVFYGGISRNATIHKGGKLWLAGGNAYNATVENGGLMEVREYQGKSSYADNIKVMNGSRLNVYNDSFAEKITIHSGGMVRVYYTKALISDITIKRGGLLHVWKHGTAQNVYVEPGGVLELREESPVLKGNITVAGQLKVSFDHTPNVSQAKIIVDLTKRNINDDYAIVNLDFMKNANISVKISADQKCGLYKLATAGKKWQKSWNIKINQAELQLYPGKTIKVTNKYYTLVKDFDDFKLSISSTKEVSYSWQRTIPEDSGYDSGKLELIADFIKNNTGTTGLLVAVNGKILYAYGDIKKISYIASCRKSVLSMLYGKYVANGTIDLKATLKELKIDDRYKLLPIEKRATVFDLITSRSGIYHPASNEGSSGKVKTMKRGSVTPGTTFIYNNWDFNAAGTIFENLTQKSIYIAAQEDIFTQIGMEDFQLSKHHRSGNKNLSVHMAYHFHLSTRDMARLGELMRCKGKWKGKQIIPEKWVTFSTTPVTEFDSGERSGYSIMWWNLRDFKYPEEFKDAYTASGMYGQYITVLPALNMVIAHKSAKNGSKPTSRADYRKIIHMVIAAKQN